MRLIQLYWQMERGYLCEWRSQHRVNFGCNCKRKQISLHNLRIFWTRRVKCGVTVTDLSFRDNGILMKSVWIWIQAKCWGKGCSKTELRQILRRCERLTNQVHRSDATSFKCQAKFVPNWSQCRISDDALIFTIVAPAESHVQLVFAEIGMIGKWDDWLLNEEPEMPHSADKGWFMMHKYKYCNSVWTMLSLLVEEGDASASPADWWHPKKRRIHDTFAPVAWKYWTQGKSPSNESEKPPNSWKCTDSHRSTHSYMHCSCCRFVCFPCRNQWTTQEHPLLPNFEKLLSRMCLTCSRTRCTWGPQDQSPEAKTLPHSALDRLTAGVLSPEGILTSEFLHVHRHGVPNSTGKIALKQTLRGSRETRPQFVVCPHRQTKMPETVFGQATTETTLQNNKHEFDKQHNICSVSVFFSYSIGSSSVFIEVKLQTAAPSGKLHGSPRANSSQSLSRATWKFSSIWIKLHDSQPAASSNWASWLSHPNHTRSTY